jgi:tetratricopeptide (TPR) repeat protein
MTSGTSDPEPDGVTAPEPGDGSIPAEAFDLYERGRELLTGRHAHQAVTVLEQAHAIAPEFSPLHELLGRAYYATRRYDEAAAEFTRAVERDPADDYAHFGLALCLLKAGSPELATGHLRMALAMRPDSMNYRRALDRALAARAAAEEAGPGEG